MKMWFFSNFLNNLFFFAFNLNLFEILIALFSDFKHSSLLSSESRLHALSNNTSPLFGYNSKILSHISNDCSHFFNAY